MMEAAPRARRDPPLQRPTRRRDPAASLRVSCVQPQVAALIVSCSCRSISAMNPSLGGAHLCPEVAALHLVHMPQHCCDAPESQRRTTVQFASVHQDNGHLWSSMQHGWSCGWSHGERRCGSAASLLMKFGSGPAVVHCWLVGGVLDDRQFLGQSQAADH